MKKLFFSAAICAAALLGFTACSDSLTDIPENPDTRMGIQSIWIEGPSSIEIGQLYFFDVKGHNDNGFNFKVEDTYFNDPSSYSFYVSPTGTRIGLIFNEYGHFKITATDKVTGRKCAYEVAKYYKQLHYLKYINNTITPYIGMPIGGPVLQWFECYMDRNPATLDYRGQITSFEHRIVMNAKQGQMAYMWKGGTDLKRTPSETDEIITGTARKGDYVITLPDSEIKTHPESDFVNIGYLIPWCSGYYSIPTERCGAVEL